MSIMDRTDQVTHRRHVRTAFRVLMWGLCFLPGIFAATSWWLPAAIKLVRK